MKYRIDVTGRINIGTKGLLPTTTPIYEVQKKVWSGWETIADFRSLDEAKKLLGELNSL